MANLTSVAHILKSRRFWAIVLIATTTFLLFAFLFSKISGLGGKASQSSWRGVIPGKTKEDQLTNLLGAAVDQKQEGGKTIYQYSSESRYRPNDVIVEQNKVVLVKEEIFGPEKGILTDYITKFGKPAQVLYGTHGMTAPLYLFAKAGLAIYANPHDGKILEIWYFQPTTTQSFTRNFGQGLTINAPRRF